MLKRKRDEDKGKLKGKRGRWNKIEKDVFIMGSQEDTMK